MAAEPLVSEHSPFEAEITIKKFKRYKFPDIDQIAVELIQTEVKILHLNIHILLLFGIRKNCHKSGSNLLLYLFAKTVIKWNLVIIGEYQL
jgi:hypothetical protein